ncbi:hypothetical protein MQW34_29130 (plasmid) [Bacillus sp. ZJS3]|uniref:hypothetical protein n=1 Tax=Bacillus sp. ZJS3 TaxID=2928154 RepID=UPI001FB2C06E|nr:hypothetical protein [Bacillus sp. ZJS3]UOB82077.1 hypothetical protein MQW34_29130 [Bacillus sp. ZJS3]
MENKLSGVLAATLALTMSLPTGALASSSSKNPVVSSQEVASKDLEKIAAENGTVVFAGGPNSEFTIALN